MYPSNLQTNLRRREGAYGQTSLARTFTRNSQTGLSLVARSTFSSKESRQSSAISRQVEQSYLRGEDWWLKVFRLRDVLIYDEPTGPVAQVARAHP